MTTSLTLAPEVKIVVFPEKSVDFEQHIEAMNAWPFRQVGIKPHEFNVDEQIDGCARLIAALRDLAGQTIWETFAQSGQKKATYERILKKSLKDAIRISGESLDHTRTVDYVTKTAMDVIRLRSKGGIITADQMKVRKDLHHEHMVPGEEVCRNLVREKPDLDGIRRILRNGSCRAIVFRNPSDKNFCEKHRLDKVIESARGVPEVISLPNDTTLRKQDLQPEWHGLFRYHWSGLIDELIPVSKRGKELLENYRAFVHNFIATG